MLEILTMIRNIRPLNQKSITTMIIGSILFFRKLPTIAIIIKNRQISYLLEAEIGNAPYRARSARGTDPVLTRAACTRSARRARRTRRSLPDSRLPSWPCSIRLPLPLPRSMPPTRSTPATSVPLCGFELRAGVELRVDEPHSSKQQAD
jgi:hypothetical protein